MGSPPTLLPAAFAVFRAPAWQPYALVQPEGMEKCGQRMRAEHWGCFPPFFPSIFEIQIECNFQLI